MPGLEPQRLKYSANRYLIREQKRSCPTVEVDKEHVAAEVTELANDSRAFVEMEPFLLRIGLSRQH